ncbi:MAG: ABC transporter ATP-binding protein, partial [Bacteroidaceae bacterium]|nr:ABC transporter ATP-binding protein [Bacteroidaceae bacterium]
IVAHDRYFMDKVVDPLLVFKGGGEVRDFPGNYTQFREAQKSIAREWAIQEKSRGTVPSSQTVLGVKPRITEKRRRLTFKERTEFAQLEKDIEVLEKEKSEIEAALSGGTITVDEITAMSKRLPLLNVELDEKSMRWLELSEFA